MGKVDHWHLLLPASNETADTPGGMLVCWTTTILATPFEQQLIAIVGGWGQAYCGSGTRDDVKLKTKETMVHPKKREMLRISTIDVLLLNLKSKHDVRVVDKSILPCCSIQSSARDDD